MITPVDFLERIGLDNQSLQKKFPAAPDLDLLKVLERFSKMNEPEKLLKEFWQRSSDACPLEASLAEKEERDFEEWVKEKKF